MHFLRLLVLLCVQQVFAAGTAHRTSVEKNDGDKKRRHSINESAFANSVQFLCRQPFSGLSLASLTLVPHSCPGQQA